MSNATAARESTGTAATQAVSSGSPTPSTRGSGARPIGMTTFGRTTVLPRRDARTSGPAVHDASPRYEWVRALGEGGMGEVVLVHDHDIGRNVAVKRLKAAPDDEAAVLRFAEEVRTIGHLEHPGIVPVHDVGVDEQGLHYLVMKYVEGDTLDVIIRKLRDGDPATRAKYDHVARAHVFLSLLQALRYAHEKGVIHRDLKPSNVMVGPYGEVMLMDWGIAKKIERGVPDGPESGLADTVDPKLGPQRLVQTAVGSLLGTPLYMSPEQAAGKVNELDERSDVYSAALVLLELLSLRHPYEDRKTVPELLIAQSRDELGGTELGMLLAADEAPQQFIWFLHKALHKDRTQRFATVADMERELRRVLDGRVAVQCGVTFGKRMGEEYLHWIDRNPRGFLLALKLVGLLVIGLLVLGGMQLVRAF